MKKKKLKRLIERVLREQKQGAFNSLADDPPSRYITQKMVDMIGDGVMGKTIRVQRVRDVIIPKKGGIDASVT